MHNRQMTIATVGLFMIVATVQAQEDVWRFDCGTPESAVVEGNLRLTARQTYNKARGYGWEQGRLAGLEFRRPVRDRRLRGSAGQLLLEEAYDNHRNALNRDGVVSRDDLTFRLDVPDGTYRVAITMGDLSKAIGSIDLSVNGSLVAEQLAVWAPGGYRLLDRTPAGWWNTFRTTANVTDGKIRIGWKKNQKHYDEQMAEQATGETPYAQWYHRVPIIQEPPYHYIGYPFVGHSVMGIEVVPYKPGPVEMVDGKPQLHQRIDSAVLTEAIKRYNAGDFDAALAALERAKDPQEQVAKVVVMLWHAGRLETEIEQEVVPKALEVL